MEGLESAMVETGRLNVESGESNQIVTKSLVRSGGMDTRARQSTPVAAVVQMQRKQICVESPD